MTIVIAWVLLCLVLALAAGLAWKRWQARDSGDTLPAEDGVSPKGGGGPANPPPPR